MVLCSLEIVVWNIIKSLLEYVSRKALNRVGLSAYSKTNFWWWIWTNANTGLSLEVDFFWKEYVIGKLFYISYFIQSNNILYRCSSVDVKYS